MLQDKSDEDYEEFDYKCQEKATKSVSVAWKVLHVTIFILLAFLGLMGAVCLYYLQEVFDGRCVLYAAPSHKEMDFVQNTLFNNTAFPINNKTIVAVDNGNTNSTNSSNSNVTNVARNTNFRELDKSHWRLYHIVFPVSNSTINYCSFIFFITLVSVVSATIFGTFFMVCSKGGRGYNTDILRNPQHLMYPIIILCFVMIIMTIAAATYFHNGIDDFCQSFSGYFQNCLLTLDDIAMHMKDHRHRYPLSMLYQLIEVALVASLVLWIAQLAIAILRIVFIVDYEIFRIRPKPQKDDDDDVDGEDEDLTQSVTLPSYSSALLADGTKVVEADTKV